MLYLYCICDSVFKRFRELDPKTVDQDPRKAKIELETILTLPELRVNIFV